MANSFVPGRMALEPLIHLALRWNRSLPLRDGTFGPRIAISSSERGDVSMSATKEESLGFLPWIIILVSVIVVLLVYIAAGV